MYFVDIDRYRINLERVCYVEDEEDGTTCWVYFGGRREPLRLQGDAVRHLAEEIERYQDVMQEWAGPAPVDLEQEREEKERARGGSGARAGAVR